MNKRELKIPFSAALNKSDTETQTYGCRQNNPDICASNSIPGVCAFTRKYWHNLVCFANHCLKKYRNWKWNQKG